MPESSGGVRTIYPQRPGRNDGNIYVGTTRNNILEGSLQRRFNQVVFGHGRQLWGLAAHPEDELFATAGHDKNVALWRRHKLIWTSAVRYYYEHLMNEIIIDFHFSRLDMNVFHCHSIHLAQRWQLVALKDI